MDVNNINIADLSDADRAVLFAQFLAQQETARAAAREAAAARRAVRLERRGFVAKLVGIISERYPDATVFRTVAEGWSRGGKNSPVKRADGSERLARVSLLVRWEDTIPATDTTDVSDDD